MTVTASAFTASSGGISPNSFAVADARAHLGASRARRRPYIRAASPHYAYALLVTRPGDQRYTHVQACTELGINPNTAKKWRRKLIADGREFFGDLFGDEPPYEFCARFALAPESTERELRQLFNGN